MRKTLLNALTFIDSQVRRSYTNRGSRSVLWFKDEKWKTEHLSSLRSWTFITCQKFMYIAREEKPMKKKQSNLFSSYGLYIYLNLILSLNPTGSLDCVALWHKRAVLKRSTSFAYTCRSKTIISLYPKQVHFIHPHKLFIVKFKDTNMHV